MPSITADNKKESEEFITALSDMLEIIDTIAPLITDNNYLLLCNGLKKLNDLKSKDVLIRYIEVVRERVATNQIVQNQRKRSKMKIKTQRDIYSTEYKLKNGWTMCKNCDRLVMDIHAHRFTSVCKQTNDSKKMSASTSSVDTTKYNAVIYKLRAVFCRYDGFKRNMNFIKSKMNVCFLQDD
jgi:hypothetical protein